ncbi:unnamed protein product [Dovyalis caffra]|uniref:Uncharacterized protein n=1 Tax=Dovyalis caffra TaxID=77055 RepID=A0AAV1RXN9_9ROSI|nr:unnamed protein product [Dovyalis caffra]
MDRQKADMVSCGVGCKRVEEGGSCRMRDMVLTFGTYRSTERLSFVGSLLPASRSMEPSIIYSIRQLPS